MSKYYSLWAANVFALALLISLSWRPSNVTTYLWTAIAMVGCNIQWVALRDAITDRAYLRQTGKNGPLAVIANVAVRNAVMRLCVMSGNIVLGVLACFVIQPHINVPTYNLVLGYITVGILLAGEATLVTLTTLERIDRRRIADGYLVGTGEVKTP